MAKRYDDPRFVLAALNSLGYIYVSAKVLQDFMRDIKTHGKLKEKAHKAWKKRIIRQVHAFNRNDMENYMNELRSKQAACRLVADAVDNESGEQSSQHPRHLLNVAELQHPDQSFDIEKSAAGKQIQKSPFRGKEKSFIETSEATRKNRLFQPGLTDPSSSGEKSRDQSRKISETGPKKQQTIRYDFDIATEDSDSYQQLPGQTTKGDGKDKSQVRKDQSLIGKSFNEHLFESNFEVSDSYKTLPNPQEKTEARNKYQTEKSKVSRRQTYNKDFPSSFEQSDSYKTLPKPRERTEAKDRSQTEKSKSPLKKTYNQDFPSSFEQSDSYKQLPGAKENIHSQFQSRGAGRGTITPRKLFDKDFPSSLEASDSYKQIARKPRDQGEDKSREKSRQDRMQTIAEQNPSPRRDKTTPMNKQMSATLQRKDKSKSVEEKSQSDDTYKNLIESGLNYSDFQRVVIQRSGRSSPVDKNLSANRPRDLQGNKSGREQSQIISTGTRTDVDENFIGSGLDYSDFQQNITQGRSSSLGKVPLDQKSPEQFSLKGLRDRSHLDFDSSSSTESSQRANRGETDRNLVARDRVAERPQLTSRELKEVTCLRFDDSDSESDSESNYLEQPEAVRPSEEVGRIEEQKKSQNSAQSTPNFRQRREINYDSSSKSDSESISQAAARSRKEEIVKTGKTPARSGRFKPDDYVNRSHLEF